MLPIYRCKRHSRKSHYQHIGILEGHEECVNSLLLMDKGDLLASGGTQGHLCFEMDAYHIASRI